MFHDAGDTKCGRDGHGENGGFGTDCGTNDAEGQGADGSNQNDERNGANKVHQNVEDCVDELVAQYAVFTRGVEQCSQC